MSLKVDIKKKLASFTLEVAFECEDQTLGFLGASGCGKSMTLRCIAGVEKPDEGKIIVDGQTYFDSAAKINLTPQQRKTALLFQNFQLFPHLTVGANVAAGIGRDVPKDQAHAEVQRQLKRFHLEGCEKRYPLHLSGGQQQRVALARMLAANPKILMLDEPFSALDAHLKSMLEQDLLALFDSYAGSILYVSHDIDEAFRFCDRIAVVDQGHICELNETQQIVSHPSTLATIKLSGCKNTSRAAKISDHEVDCLDWGFSLQSRAVVPDDVEYMGVRAFYIQIADGQSHNVVPCVVERVSDSRFERTAMVAPQANPDCTHRIQWRVDKLKVPKEQLPETGDTIDLYFQPNNLYLVTG